jgi:uncharacterized protein
MNYQQYIPLIVEELKKAEPEKIILFGSYAYGQPNEDSDVDIILITSDEYMPKSFREKMNLYHRINPYIDQFRKHIPIDLLIYTKSMYKILQERASLFSKEINLKGKVLYERSN